MNDMFSCQDKDSLIAFLYDEVEPRLRQRIEAHVRTCRACTEELAALSAVRGELLTWMPPETELGIAIAKKADLVKPARWWSEIPAWAQVAAAVLVLAVSAGIANIQVRSGPDGVVVTSGWMSPAGAVAAPQPGSAPSEASADARWKVELTALESRLRDEIRSNRVTAAEPVALAARSADADATLKQVQALLAASEQRQRQELALRLTQLSRDVEVQRQADLMRISQGFGQFEGRTGEMMARQRQMLNYVMRVSGQPQQ